MSVKIFITGGTFDKEYNYITGQLYFKDTHMKDMLKLGRCNLDVDIRTLMMEDSLKLTDDDRNIIVHNCQKSKAERILITHGTDTMVETAEMLAEKIENKTIVITGAMVPYAFGSSDGLFNLGSALAFVQSMPHGIYIAMNGRCYDWNNVKKNRKTGFFEDLGRE